MNPKTPPRDKPMRLDALLAEGGWADSREQAKRLILAGEVLVDNRVVDKPATKIAPDADVTVKSRPKYVSRGGLKLEGALNHFAIDPTNWVCFDAGASTGGFTDCLLQRGAKRIYAYDVGTNQLAWKLRSHERIVAREQFNIRHMKPEDVPELVDLAVIDVSFISLELILPPVARILKKESHAGIVALIKPQFEVARNDVGKGGIVRDEIARQAAAHKIRFFAESELALHWRGTIDSPIKGTDGNAEYLTWLTPLPPPSQ